MGNTAQPSVSLRKSCFLAGFGPVGYWDLADFEYVANNLRESFRIIAAARSAGEVRELHGCQHRLCRGDLSNVQLRVSLNGPSGGGVGD